MVKQAGLTMLAPRPTLRLQPGQRLGAYHRGLRRMAFGGPLPYRPSPDLEPEMPEEPDLMQQLKNEADIWRFDKREREDPTKRRGGRTRHMAMAIEGTASRHRADRPRRG
jgi:hypothetical protein